MLNMMILKVCEYEKKTFDELFDSEEINFGCDLSTILSSLINLKDLTVYENVEIPKTLKNLEIIWNDGNGQKEALEIPDYLVNLTFLGGNIKNIPKTLTKLKKTQYNQYKESY